MPAGYGAYVRLPHPYWLDVSPGTDGAFYDPPDSGADSGNWYKPVRRSEAARLQHTSKIWSRLDPPIDSAMGAPPLIRPLVGVLRRYTPGEVPCFCGFWKVQLPTFGRMVMYRAESQEAPLRANHKARHVESTMHVLRARYKAWRLRRLIADTRTHRSSGQVLLYQCRLHQIESWLSGFGPIKAHYHPPTVFWPEDRRWCVAMPQNKPVSIVAGPRALADDLLGLTDIDAFDAKRSDSVWGE